MNRQRKMRTKRRQTVDENNNAIDVDNASIRLDDDSTVVRVGDIVWLNQNGAMHFLTTPFIIEHFNGEQKKNFLSKKRRTGNHISVLH